MIDRNAAEVAQTARTQPYLELLFLLDFSFLVFQMQNGAPLRVVERGGPIEDADDERAEHDAGHGLQPQPPAHPAENSQRKAQAYRVRSCKRCTWVWLRF